MKAGTDRRPRRGEEGIALIYVAIFLLVSLWFVSLAIDIGKIMAAKTELQAAADAAALAGASAIDPKTGETVQDSARVRAAYTALQNKALEQVKTPIVIDPQADVEFPGDPDQHRVKVTVHRDAAHGDPVLLHFAQTLGIPSVGVRADATAEAKPLSAICENLVPFAPQEPPTGGFSNDCDSVYTLKVGAGNSSSGNFQLLDFPPCADDDFQGSGGAAIRQYTQYGYKCCIGIGDEFVLTEPGNKVGPLSQALNARWDADTDKREGICFDEYIGNRSRVFLTPIIQSFDVNGKKFVKIVQFAAFFLRYRPNGSMVNQGVTGQFIQYVAPGDFGSTPPDSTVVYGVHLVE
jgi:hypothetical protein